ncbi:L,D-transpeptidase family protein [Labrys wisconsinensis]|uniref:Murein L,D-transpeptidase YcbB/YkuD n=1 Tax=Labrys wisconsinensis TaxID=425677 RepID=A0ABU0J9F2_9HYPH|nr:L,D-transpeptidase family protein [Labrys wisconsinensis]MDQ0470235.1 murein L,D-transpeptidase YcbB/YkuD [Labrys wisconsinensis]
MFRSAKLCLAAASIFVLCSSALAQTPASDPLLSPAPLSGAPAAAPLSAAPAAATPAAPTPEVKKRRPRPVASASTPQPPPVTPWTGMPTFDAGSLDRLNGLSQFYARIARSGGFPPAPPATLGRGAKGPAVALLRQRLVMEGDLAADDRGDGWDAALTTALQRYQMRNGIAPTGAMNDRTRAAMAVPVEKRLIQIGHNMERLGARFVDFAQRYVVVNLPSAQVEAIENGQVVRRYVAVVGRPQNASPEVDATISAVNVNPTWTVPQSIIKKEIGPHMVKDPSYLARQGMKVLDGSGKEVNPASIDWSSDKALNYTLRQNSGLGNALGQLRIQMPNSEAVYMHDTPSKKLFGATDRFFSHGCVRVQGVNDLAAWLLGPGWDSKRIAQEIATGQRKDLSLPDRVPVHWVYMTAYVTPDGAAHFRDDVYGLDFGQQVRVASAQ